MFDSRPIAFELQGRSRSCSAFGDYRPDVHVGRPQRQTTSLRSPLAVRPAAAGLQTDESRRTGLTGGRGDAQADPC